MSLSCPQPGNFAAIAKQMHKTALEAENAIMAIEQRLRAAVNHPTLVQTTTASQTGIIANTDEILGSGVPFVNNFANFGIGTGMQVFSDRDPYMLLPEGMYEVGFCGTIVPSGAANVDSQRTIMINHTRPDPSTFLDPTIDFSHFTVYEAGTGNGVHVSITGVFRIRPLDRLIFILNHANVASTLTVELGAIFWMHRLSDVDITEVL